MLRRMPGMGAAAVRAALARRFEEIHGRKPNLDDPVGFNEQMLHRILYEHDPRLRTLCDKLAAREVIRQRAGLEFVVPVLGIWRDPAEIDWASLPSRFVLKPTHGSGMFALVRGPADRDPARLAAQARDWLADDYFDISLEWAYRDLPRRLVAEPLLVGRDGGPPAEAEVFTFGGKVALIRVMTDEKLSTNRRDNWFDAAGNRLPLRVRATPGDYVLSAADLRVLVPAAERIAAGFSQLRVDFLLTADGMKIGELTPYHVAGHALWNPADWDARLGRMWLAAKRDLARAAAPEN
jgi:hypothetical protein